jgi:HEAT repeat protein
VPIFPHQFDSTPAYDLLSEAEKGLVGFDGRLIQSLLGRPEETVAALTRFAAGEREPQLLDLTEQVFDLFRQLRAPEAVPFYLKLLRSQGQSIPDPLIEALADIGSHAVEPLLELHDQMSEDDRADIVFVLATLGVHDDRIRALIEKAIAKDHYEGALCAGLYGDVSLKPAVQACLEETRNPEERKVLQECIETLESERAPHQPEPFDILKLYPDESLPLFDQIAPEDVLKFFDAPGAEYRARAALSFTDDDYPDEIRDRLLRLAEGDPEPQVRGAAWRALGERVAEPEIRRRLIGVLETRREVKEEWLGALVGLAGATSEPEVYEAVLEAYAHEPSRAAALQTMWRSLDPRFRKNFAPCLKSEDLEVKRQAIQGVGALPISELAMELVPLFADESVREEALFSYALAVPHQTTPKSVNKLFDMISTKADGLSDSEEESVLIALDRRLEREGYQPVFFPPEGEDEDGHEHAAAPPAQSDKVGRNDPCPCGSGKKYKKCCGA